MSTTDVANEQRKVVYQQRLELLDADNISDSIEAIVPDVTGELVDRSLPAGVVEEDWDIEGLEKTLEKDFGLRCPVAAWCKEDEELGSEGVADKVIKQALAAYHMKESAFGVERLHQIEKILMLQVLDMHWKEHLAAMDYLRQGIGLRSFAQRNPRQEYKREAFEMFEVMLQRVRYDFVSRLFAVQLEIVKEGIKREEPVPTDKVVYRHDSVADVLHPRDRSPVSAANPGTGTGTSAVPGSTGAAALSRKAQLRDRKKVVRKAFKKAAKRMTRDQMREAAEMVSAGSSVDEAMAAVAAPADAGDGGPTQAGGGTLQTLRREQPKIGRNSPCHCGSGKKFKHCHGKSD